jgi:hypothetical protein
MRFKPRSFLKILFTIFTIGIVTGLMIVSFPDNGRSSAGGGGETIGSNQAEIDKFEIKGDLPVVDGIPVTKEREIIIEVTSKGAPTHYSICENAEFDGCGWKKLPFNGRIRYLLSEGSGIKKIYFRARYLRQKSAVVTAEVNYQPE